MDHPLKLVNAVIQELEEALSSPFEQATIARGNIRQQVQSLDLDSDMTEARRHTHSQEPEQEDDMTARLTNLESHVSQLRVDVAEVRTKVSHIEENMLTKGKAAIYAMGAVLSLFAGGWWVVQQYLAPLLKASGAS